MDGCGWAPASLCGATKTCVVVSVGRSAATTNWLQAVYGVLAVV